ncbi:MAG: Processing alpha glucosidase I [Trizodia sp. TS-e1964]|nr:MAG: Processing alpha glucosidase I [Trizodia sp. TS-e1964]
MAILRLWLVIAAVTALNPLLGVQAAEEQAHLKANDYEQSSNQSLLWGPYRPNLYFGVRPRIPKSLMAGLMWTKVDNFQTVQNTKTDRFPKDFRHTCEQNEGMAGYGWDEYDVRTGGKQVVHDSGNNMDVETDFVKVPGGNHGGSWGVRIKGTPRADAPPNHKSTVIFYATMQGIGSLEVINKNDERGFKGDIHITGSTVDLADFDIKITEGPSTNAHPAPRHPSAEEKPLDRTLVHSFQLNEETLWQMKPTLFAHMKEEVDRNLDKYGAEHPSPPWQLFTISNSVGPGNLHMVQKVFEGPFEFDVLFSSKSAPEPLTSAILSQKIKANSKSFSQRFSQIFAPKAPFDKSKYEQFGRSLLSNLVGGIGYFYGDSVVDRSYAPEYDEENEGFWEEAAEARGRKREKLEGPTELFTSIPSRPFFPRGFLWDEGFHLLPVADWDMDLTLGIVKSWFNLVDEDGWIGREQILGAEARSKVPAEFQVQYPHIANPPTLFLVLEAFIDKLQAKKDGKVSADPLNRLRNAPLDDHNLAMEYLHSIYPLLKRHYFWFRKTQWGEIKSYDREAFSTKEAYRWRGRTPQHILASGLDDYPRPLPPHPGELHVDLISWVGMMTRSIKRIAAFLSESDDVAQFTNFETAILKNIDILHWDDKAQAFCDATIDDYEESIHVCHKGYISIFPFLVGLLPIDSPRLGKILDLISDPEELWSEFGLRSLSKSDPEYGTAENYWRSPIWINMNYLAIQRLLEISTSKGPFQNQARPLYKKLRENIVDNVYAQWRDTGFAWEQYNPETGAGQRTQHFTGWTSLVVKIMTMPSLDGDGERDEL